MPACTLNRIVFNPTTARLSVGGSLVANAIGLDKGGVEQHGTAFTWASDNTNVATVSATGLIVGVKTGICNVTATSGSVTGSILIQVGRRDS